MNIRAKAMLLIGTTAFALIAGLYIISRTILIDIIEDQEIRSARQNAGRALKALSYVLSSLNSTCEDWASWDDTYNFIFDAGEEYINTNLLPTTFITLKLNFMIFADNSCQVVFGKGFNLDSQIFENIPESLKGIIKYKNRLTNHIDKESSVLGIINLDNRFALISSRPITKSDKSGDIAGSLIIGRYFSGNEITFLEELTASRITLFNSDGIDNGIKLLNLFPPSNNPSDIADITVVPQSQSAIAAYALVNDIYGRPSMVIKLESPREIYYHGISNMKFFIAAFIVCTLVIFVICILLMQKIVISRLERLNGFIRRLIITKDVTSRIDMKGRDDISSLAYSTNILLEELGKIQHELRDREERLKLVLEGTNDGFWDWFVQTDDMFFSRRFLQILEYEPGDIGNRMKAMETLIHPQDLPHVKLSLDNNLNERAQYMNVEFRMRTKSGKWKWVLNKGKVVKRDENGKPVRMAGALSDISEQKQAEEEIRYLTFYDKLTGLYNRTWLEIELERIDMSGQLPITIIMGDLNGLKMTNDVFGHTVGDRLLQLTSRILRDSCRKSDFVARWGGDEFVIILFSSDEQDSRIICSRIREACTEPSGIPVKPSIALGSATKTSLGQSIFNLLTEAETRMYRNKLLESKSARNAIISSLMQTLAEKNVETEEHTLRIRDMCLKMGQRIGLEEEKMDQLVLLATLHDIGKVAIPDSILAKSGPLTPEEWEIMKRHAEAGYRIAESTLELNHIAQAILYHHERYDGHGYPHGLKGDAIPVISRILAIVDAYDAMTNKRPYYKETLSKKEAIEDIKRCSGSQFDPNLADVFVSMMNQGNQGDDALF